MDLTQRFAAACAGAETCAEPVFACAPKHAGRTTAADLRRMYAAGVDVLGAACGFAALIGAERTRLLPGVAAWGVAEVAGRHTVVLWDGRSIWAKGRAGATRLKPQYVLAAWVL